MTDHAKALADALLRLANSADSVGVRFFDTDTMEPEVEDMQSATKIAREALAAYDAHPAEAATRENGAPKKSYTMAVATDVLAWFTPHLKHIVSFHTLCEAMERILSTHQQQGAGSEYPRYIVKPSGMNSWLVIEEAVTQKQRSNWATEKDARYESAKLNARYSRAPQPDAVTDSAKRLLDGFARFLTVCGEGGKSGRPMDLIDKGDWNHAVLTCAAERITIEAALSAKTPATDFTDEATVRGIEDMKHD